MTQILDNNLRQGEKLEFFRNFHSTEQANDFSAFLNKHAIQHSLESSDVLIDRAIVGQGLVPKFTLKLYPSDFKKVNQILEKEIKKLDKADIQEHYLNQLDNKELREVLEKPDEWSAEDVNFAKALLNIRGEDISDEEVLQLRTKRFKELRAGKEGNRFIMFLYLIGILAGFFTSLIFPIAGIGMGYYYAYDKSIDPDGHSYATFKSKTQYYGKWIFYGGIVFLLMQIYWIYYFVNGEIAVQDLFGFY